jgi:hypothetical protein
MNSGNLKDGNESGSLSAIDAGHAAPSPSSGCAAPALRFGRFAVTAPDRRGRGLSSRVADEGRPMAAIHQQRDLQTKRQRRAERSRFASAIA